MATKIKSELSLGIKLRDCNTMKFQDPEFCANCYKVIEDPSSAKTFSDHFACDSNSTENNDTSSITIIQALISVFDLHRKSHLSPILLDENKYVLCSSCLDIFAQLYARFKEFIDSSSPPSYLSGIFGQIKKTSCPSSLLLVEIKAEPDFFGENTFDGFDYYSSGFAVGSPGSSVVPIEQQSKKRIRKRKYYSEASVDSINHDDSDNEDDLLHELPNDDDYTNLDEDKDDDPDFEGHDSNAMDFLDDQSGELKEGQIVPIQGGEAKAEGNNNESLVSRPRRVGRPRKSAISQVARVKRNYVKKKQQSTKRKTILQSKSRRRKSKNNSFSAQKKVKQTSFACTECTAVFKRRYHLKRHSVQHITKEFMCECGVGFCVNKHLKYHQRTICPNNPDAAKYLADDYEYEDEYEDAGDSEVDNASTNTRDPSAEQSKKKPRKRRVVVCPYAFCGKKFKRKSTLMRHEERHKERPYTCEHCKQSFRANEILQLHIFTSCPVLNNLASLPTDDVNISINTDDSTLTIPSNNNTVNTSQISNASTAIIAYTAATAPTTTTTTTQESQDQELQTSLSLLTEGNISSEAGDEQGNSSCTTVGLPAKKPVKKYSYSCYCGATFSRSNHLYRHSLTHMENPFTCPDCYTKFITQLELDMHTQKHNGNCRRPCKRRSLGENGESQPKKATCPICGRIVNAQSLKYHLESHGTEKLHVCEICGHAVKSKKTLNNHKTYAHSSIRRYLCRFCGRDFKTNQQLKFHEMRNHDDTTRLRKAMKKDGGLLTATAVTSSSSASAMTGIFNPNDYNIPPLPVLQSQSDHNHALGSGQGQDHHFSSSSDNNNSNLLMQEDYSNSSSQNVDDGTREQEQQHAENLLMNLKPRNISQIENIKLTIQQQIASNLIAPLNLDASSSASRTPSTQNIPTLSHLYSHHSFPFHRPVTMAQKTSTLQQHQEGHCSSSPSAAANDPENSNSSSLNSDPQEFGMVRSTFSQHKDFQ